LTGTQLEVFQEDDNNNIDTQGEMSLSLEQDPLSANFHPSPLDLPSSCADNINQSIEFISPQKEANIFSGSLQQFSVMELLEFLAHGRRSGMLLFSSESSVSSIYLFNGDIIGVASPATPNIGNILLSHGVITKKELQDALVKHPNETTGKSKLFASYLLEYNIVEPEHLRKALFEQITKTMMEILNWQDGHFAFDPNVNHGNLSLQQIAPNTQFVLMESCRMIDEEGRT